MHDVSGLACCSGHGFERSCACQLTVAMRTPSARSDIATSPAGSIDTALPCHCDTIAARSASLRMPSATESAISAARSCSNAARERALRRDESERGHGHQRKRDHHFDQRISTLNVFHAEAPQPPEVMRARPPAASRMHRRDDGFAAESAPRGPNSKLRNPPITCPEGGVNESSVDVPAMETDVIAGCMRKSVETPSRSTNKPHPHDQSVTPLSQLRPDARQ